MASNSHSSFARELKLLIQLHTMKLVAKYFKWLRLTRMFSLPHEGYEHYRIDSVHGGPCWKSKPYHNQQWNFLQYYKLEKKREFY